MKFLKKVQPIEVKRCFVISDYVSHHKYLKQPLNVKNESQYLQKLNKAKKIILELPEEMLDMVIKGEWRTRYKIYKKMEWYLGEVKTSEVGVWKHAGGIKTSWTYGSLEETGKLVAKALEEGKKLSQRSQTAIPGILKNSLSIIQKEKYLFPIILPGGTIGRKGLKKMKGDIDDGCMRSIALAVSGKKTIKAYIGKIKRK